MCILTSHYHSHLGWFGSFSYKRSKQKKKMKGEFDVYFSNAPKIL